MQHITQLMHRSHFSRVLKDNDGPPKASIMSSISVPEHSRSESGVDAQSPDKKRERVPEWLRNESGVENKSTGKRRRKDNAIDKMMEIWKESQKNRQEFTRQILDRCDAILSNVSNVPTVPELNETDVLFAEHGRIIDYEKMMAMDTSTSASMKANILKVLNLQREELDAKFVAHIAKQKRKASEWSGTSS
jgi:hypothetical protein